VAKKEAVPRPGSSKKSMKKRASRLTFLLYLSGEDQDEAGGETLLLEREEPDSPLMASVKPKRGRLLVFPHSCPHASSAVLQPPKILIRGEFL
jgi:Rps23 Pro-64 3,4-dihydroxylase Tpa1-like proline 4-hydroxylase